VVSVEPLHRVAVLIITYRTYPELRRCLASLAPDAASLDVIVVDHESDAAEAAAIQREFPWARILVEPANAGFAAGVNRGARETATEYLLLVNPDSFVQRDLSARLCAWMDAHPDVGVVGPAIANPDGSTQASARRFPDFTTAIAGRSSWLTRALPRNPLTRHNLPYVDARSGEPIDVDWVSGACMMIRRRAFDALGGMDEDFFLYWEDADFCRRAKRAGWRTVYYPVPGTVHVGGASSRHASDAALRAFHDSAYRLFVKHTTPAGRLLAPFVRLALRVRLAMMRRLVRRRSLSRGGAGGSHADAQRREDARR
jgi:GT2 family glycosyltransferase